MTHTDLKIYRHYDNNIDVVEHDCDYLATGNVYLADDSIDDCYINFEFKAIIKMDCENDIDDIDLEIMLIEMENISEFLQHKAYFKEQIENWLNNNCKAKIQHYKKQAMNFKGPMMKVKDLKQRQKLRNVKTGEVLQVSKKWDGRFIHLIDPTSKKLVYILARHAHDKHEAEREITEWVAA